MRRSKKTSKLRVTGHLCEEFTVPGEFPAQMASNAENVPIWWRHHEIDCQIIYLLVGVHCILPGFYLPLAQSLWSSGLPGPEMMLNIWRHGVIEENIVAICHPELMSPHHVRPKLAFVFMAQKYNWKDQRSQYVVLTWSPCQQGSWGQQWGPSEADRTQVGPMLAPRTLPPGVTLILAWVSILCGMKLQNSEIVFGNMCSFIQCYINHTINYIFFLTRINKYSSSWELSIYNLIYIQLLYFGLMIYLSFVWFSWHNNDDDDDYNGIHKQPKSDNYLDSDEGVGLLMENKFLQFNNIYIYIYHRQSRVW